MLLFSLLSVRFSSIFFILASGAAGVCAYFVRKLRKADNNSGKEDKSV